MSVIWFSAMLRFVILVEGHGTSLSRSLIVFRSEDWPEAKKRAIEIGLLMESSYIGGAGDAVRWRLEVVETLDMLGDVIGREVYADRLDLPEGQTISFDTAFDPASSNPGQSGV